jgi:hypothetical protein
MRAYELTESTIELEMVNMLKQKGYKFLGSGVDQSVWLEPGTGLVLKIFGTDKMIHSNPLDLSNEQKSFVKFANYCMAHPDNEFLPQFLGWQKFIYNEYAYLQIRCERLFEIDKGKTRVWAEELNAMARYIRLKLPLTTYLRDRSSRGRGRNAGAGYYELMSYLGEDGLAKIWKTMEDLQQIAKRSGFHLDLHPGNFMLGSDGHIVISDPFFAG